MTIPTPPKCPKCGRLDSIPYAYGHPREESLAAEKRGELILAGCVVWPGQPAYRCRRCAAEFTKDGREAVSFEQVQQAYTQDSQPLSLPKSRAKK